MSERVAAVDIGTNTLLMLIAERGPDGEPRAVEEHAEITRLGQGVDRTHMLSDEAIARTLAALERYAQRAKQLGVVAAAAVATSATRDSSNGPAFVARASEILGGPIEVASGGREALLTFRGALGGLGLSKGSDVAVIDVGGGSTEIVIGHVGEGAGEARRDGAIEWVHSFDVGSVRLTERHVRSDPPSPEALAAISADSRASFASHAPPAGAHAAVVAIAGTATTYAAIDKQLVRYEDAPPHGHVLSIDRLHAIIEQLAAVDLEARRNTIGLEPKRADVIVAGGLVLAAAAGALSASQLVISDRGVRWGLAEELLLRRP